MPEPAYLDVDQQQWTGLQRFLAGISVEAGGVSAGRESGVQATFQSYADPSGAPSDPWFEGWDKNAGLLAVSIPSFNAMAKTLNLPYGAGIIQSYAGIDMKTAQANGLYTVPTGKVWRTTALMVRDTTASLAGGTSYSVTNWRQAFSLAALTTAGTGYIYVVGADLAQYTEVAAGSTVNFTVTNGASAAGTATLDLFGYSVDV